MRSRSEELSDQLLTYSEELSAANRELSATITALEETKRQLTASEARARLTTEMMPAHIAHVGTDRRYTYSNRRLSTVLPGASSDIVGLPIEDVLGPQAYTAIAPRLDLAFRGEASVFEFNHEPSSRRIRAAFTPDDNQGGVYILSMDITEEAQTRAALQQTRRREIAAQLTSGLAHDFSNLLTIILGMQSKLQRMEPAPGPGADELITATIAAARRGGSLLNRIADMTGRREHRPVPTDLGAFLDELETLVRSTLPEGVSLSMRNLTGAHPFLLDHGMLQDLASEPRAERARRLRRRRTRRTDGHAGPGYLARLHGHRYRPRLFRTGALACARPVLHHKGRRGLGAGTDDGL